MDYLQQAIDLATENSKLGLGGPYGAVIVRGDEVLASSTNLVTKNNDPTAHAEIIAIRHACSRLNDFQLTDCILYSSCEPCPMCLAAIYWARLKAVYYACDRHDAARSGFDDSFIYDEIQLAPSQRQIPMQQVKMIDANKPFQAWKNSQTKIAYWSLGSSSTELVLSEIFSNQPSFFTQSGKSKVTALTLTRAYVFSSEAGIFPLTRKKLFRFITLTSVGIFFTVTVTLSGSLHFGRVKENSDSGGTSAWFSG